MQVRWLKKALVNLDEEASYIAHDDPKMATAFVGTLINTIELLQKNPALGRPGRVTGTRELVLVKFPYIVPYRIRRQTIEILRVFHTSRKLPQKW